MKHYQHYQPMHMALHDRSFPHGLREKIWIWSIFSEEKEIHFNGYLVQTPENEAFIVDPPCEGPEVLNAFQPLPIPKLIILTNADHERGSQQFKERFGIPIYIHEQDAALLAHKPDHTFQDGQSFPGGWQAIHLPNQKTPGESALYQTELKVLIIGDALISTPRQELMMLPKDKCADQQAARQGLSRLEDLEIQSVLTTDGDPILLNAASSFKDALHHGLIC